jgi:hypothetical protein
MPGKSGFYSEASSGTLTIVGKSLDELELDVAVKFDLKSPLSWNDNCNEYEFRSRVVTKRYQFEQLGAWEGVRDSEDSEVAESVPPRRTRWSPVAPNPGEAVRAGSLKEGVRLLLCSLRHSTKRSS